MSAFTSPRVDPASNPLMKRAQAAFDDQVARADRLTEDEASELAAWLNESGYHSVEVIQKAECCSVTWKK